VSEALLLKVPADEVFVTQRGIATIVKDPAASRDYGWDLTDWLLAGDSISNATVNLVGIDAADPDTSGQPIVNLSGDTSGDKKIAVRLFGGDPGFAEATCTFTTVSGFVDVRRIRFIIRGR
jgi:hypothetical protein